MILPLAFPEANIDLREEKTQVGAGKWSFKGCLDDWKRLRQVQMMQMGEVVFNGQLWLITDMVFSYLPSKLFLIDEQGIPALKDS